MIPSEWVDAAGEYHSGQTSGLYSISSTGAIHSPSIVIDAYLEIHRMPEHMPKTEALNQLYGALTVLYTNDIGFPIH